MRALDSIIVHCTATPYGRYHTVDEIRGWHVNGNGWSDIGYHFVIYTNGDVHKGRSIEKVGAHASGYNERSIGVCLVGGTDDELIAYDDGYSPEQYQSLVILLGDLQGVYGSLNIEGHGELPGANKACPCLSEPLLDFIRDIN